MPHHPFLGEDDSDEDAKQEYVLVTDGNQRAWAAIDIGGCVIPLWGVEFEIAHAYGTIWFTLTSIHAELVGVIGLLASRVLQEMMERLCSWSTSLVLTRSDSDDNMNRGGNISEGSDSPPPLLTPSLFGLDKADQVTNPPLASMPGQASRLTSNAAVGRDPDSPTYFALLNPIQHCKRNIKTPADKKVQNLLNQPFGKQACSVHIVHTQIGVLYN
ncbi:hypothetical protein BDN71DRAFT_1432105 [Pleurotus eryngii]|uniref:Uncharacterized protein n=1 Tax=Pleurotus eryngii TaxID=5323 RepID=A0A9P6D5Z3_PLEER|nr:hypothetical protein BDN71DRAFT_1432105 [Pleurotus eryngii]